MEGVSPIVGYNMIKHPVAVSHSNKPMMQTQSQFSVLDDQALKGLKLFNYSVFIHKHSKIFDTKRKYNMLT